MTLLEIPCTRFSRKIILRENDGEPVQLTKQHPLWALLRPHASNSATHVGIVSALISTHFVVSCEDRLAELLQSNPSDAGVVLHRFHLEAMCRFVWSLGLANVEASKAIDIWFEKYDLDDDDYSRESAYRHWTRYKKSYFLKFSKKNVTKARLNVLDLRRPGDNIFHLKSDADIDREAARIRAALLKIRPNTPEYIFEQVHQWLYVDCGRRKVRFVAKKFKKSRRRTYVALDRVRGYIQYDSEFAAVVRPTLAPTASPTL